MLVAVAKAGGIVVAVMPLLRARELSAIIDKAEIGLALCDERLGEEMQAAQAASPTLGRIVYFNGQAGEAAELDSLMAAKDGRFENCDTARDDVVLIAFTSGTSGKPKGTVHFHRDVMAICDCFPRSILKATANDIFIGSPPLAFTFGLGGLAAFPMRIGAATVLLEKATPELLAEAIARFKATVCFTAPTAYRAMLGHAAGADFSSLRKCVSAGELLPLPIFEAWREHTGIKIIDGIGSTEMLHIFISAPEEDIRPGATGKPVPGYEARVIDEGGAVAPPNQVGRLAVRGPTGCRYLADPRQRAYVVDGWNLTGDAYRMDEDGYFWFQARADDMIVSAGYNISGPEVEEVLLDHAAVAECAVVAAPRYRARRHRQGLRRPGRGSCRKRRSGGRAAGLRQAAHRPLQVPARGRVRRDAAEDRDRQDPAVRVARARERTGGGAMRRLEPAGWARPSGYAHGIAAAGRFVFVAGQVGWDPTTETFASDDLVAQARQALANVLAVLAEAEASRAHIARMTWYVLDKAEYRARRPDLGRVYGELLGRHYPAMTLVEVAGLLEARARIEIEATAVVPIERA